MTIQYKHKCTYRSGAIVFDNHEKFIEDCASRDKKRGYILLKNESNRKKPKSLQQNKYYFGYVLPELCKELWGDKDIEGMRSALKAKFRVGIKDGIKYLKSDKLSESNTVEWEEYMEDIRRWAASEHSINIKEPNEISYDNILEPIIK